MNKNTTPDLLPSMMTFINTFLRGVVKERWLNLCSSKQVRWDALDPYDLLKDHAVKPNALTLFEGRVLSEIFSDYKIEHACQERIVVASIGHAAKGLYEDSFQNALMGNSAPLEGLLLYKPAEFVVCHTHHGEAWVIAK